MNGWEGIYCGPAPAPEELLSSWNLDPLALALLVLVSLWAARTRPGLIAVVILAFVFISPLCALSSALFSARVVHHVLLVTIAAPLLAIARPERTTRTVGVPFIVAGLFTLCINARKPALLASA